MKVHAVVIRKLLNDPEGSVGKRLLKTGIRVNNKAKRLCPVDTGRLRSSITTTQPRRQGDEQLTVRVGSNVNYARFVEEGTRYMRGRHYLRTALREEVR